MSLEKCPTCGAEGHKSCLAALAENVRLTARVEELENRHARLGFQHLDGAHISTPVPECVLCNVLKERDAARVERDEEYNHCIDLRAEVESLKAQLAKEQEVLNSAHLHEQIAIGERAAAEEQLRVAREALENLVAIFKQYDTSLFGGQEEINAAEAIIAPEARYESGAASFPVAPGNEGLIPRNRRAALSASTPKAKPSAHMPFGHGGCKHDLVPSRCNWCLSDAEEEAK